VKENREGELEKGQGKERVATRVVSEEKVSLPCKTKNIVVADTRDVDGKSLSLNRASEASVCAKSSLIKQALGGCLDCLTGITAPCDVPYLSLNKEKSDSVKLSSSIAEVKQKKMQVVGKDKNEYVLVGGYRVFVRNDKIPADMRLGDEVSNGRFELPSVEEKKDAEIPSNGAFMLESPGRIVAGWSYRTMISLPIEKAPSRVECCFINIGLTSH
jgi:hypothetical protein